MPYNLPSPRAQVVLSAIAPGGSVESDDQAFDAAVAYLLRTTDWDPDEVERTAREVQRHCRERGHWGVVDGKRRLIVPIVW